MTVLMAPAVCRINAPTARREEAEDGQVNSGSDRSAQYAGAR